MDESWERWYRPEAAELGEPLQDRVKEAARRSPRYVRLVANMVRDDRVPVPAKVALAAGGAYVISPVDLVPGIIPVIGQLDDLVAILLAISAATRLCPDELVDEHLDRAGLLSTDLTRDADTVRLGIVWMGKKAGSIAGAGLRRATRVVRSGAERALSGRSLSND